MMNAMEEKVKSASIGERIRQLRIKRGLTQKQLAEMIGLEQTAISHYELGRRGIDIQTLSKIAKALQVSLKDLVESEIEVVELPQAAKVVPLYSLPASAGSGMFPDEVYILDRIPVHRFDIDFAVKVKGDSMEPIVPDGAIVFVKETPEARDGDMILCTYDDHIFVKWFHRRGDDIYLISENPLYSPIKVEEHDKFIIHGVVMDILHGGKPRRRFK